MEQNLENNTTTQELVLVADIGILGGSQEAQVVIDETVQGTHADVLGEDLVVTQTSSPIELESEHPAITTREGASNPIPTIEGGHGIGTVRSETTPHQVVTNRTTENEIHPQPQSIDEFLESISIPIQQPLVQEVPQSPKALIRT
jgi:hypothetical protein